MLATLARAGAILLISVVVAAVYVQARGLPWTVDAQKIKDEGESRRVIDVEAERMKKIRAERSVTLDELRDHIAAESIIVDTRPAELFAQAHLKAPVIINIFGEEARRPENIERLSPDTAAGRPIVFYCNGVDCHLSDLVYMALEDAWGVGALEMYIFVPGWDGIEAAKLETRTGPESDLAAGADEAVMEIPVSEEGP